MMRDDVRYVHRFRLATVSRVHSIRRAKEYDDI